MSGKQFSLYTRTNTKNQKVYYVRFKTPSGNWSTAHSTKCTNRAKAEAYATELYALQKVQGGGIAKKPKMTLKDYAGEDFFAWDGVYCRNRRATGKRINEAQSQYKTAELVRIILPYFGNYRISAIDEKAIEQFRNYLLLDRGYAGSSVNKVLSDLQTILKQARRDGLIGHVPEIEKATNTPKKTKGILSQNEVKILFSDETLWPDYLTYSANILACTTGLRLSEVMAIQLKNISSSGFIEIDKSWNTKLRKLNTSTKSGKIRRVVIPIKVQKILQKLIDLNPYQTPDSFLFFSLLITNQPIDKKVITRGLYAALDKIGIDEEQRKTRVITFHSFRYFLNSLLIAGKIPLIQVQSMTGHLTQQMSAHYFNSQIGDMKEILQIQENIF